MQYCLSNIANVIQIMSGFPYIWNLHKIDLHVLIICGHPIFSPRAILLGLSEPLLLLNFPLSVEGRKNPPVCARHPWRHSVHHCCGPCTEVSPSLSLRITKFKATWAIKPSVYLSWVCVNVLQSTLGAKFQYEMLPYE